MADLQVTILGCGNSTGIPAIGNYWGQCDPHEPKNNRTRSSLLVQQGGKALVIDTGPDFRIQLNRENISHIDAILYTHYHSDHVGGIDEIRVLKHRTQKETLNAYLNQASFKDMLHRFHYVFNGDEIGLYPPVLTPNILGAEHFGKPQIIEGIEVIPFVQDHGTCESLGYRFGDFAYSLDMLTLDEAAIETLKGVKTWVVDAAGYNQEANPVHANLAEIYRLNEMIGAERVYLSSLSLAMDYQTLLKELPEGYLPAYDGLKLFVNK